MPGPGSPIHGATGDSSQADAFRGAGLRVHEAGDGAGVAYIEGAMRAAMEVVDAINAPERAARARRK